MYAHLQGTVLLVLLAYLFTPQRKTRTEIREGSEHSAQLAVIEEERLGARPPE